MLLHRSATTLIAAGALALAAAAPAAADSIAYVKGGDVYLATTDTHREFQVTTGGGYSTVSQADDGTLVATAGTHLRKLDRFGAVLSDVETPMGQNAGSYMTFKGPYDADVSPDGTKAAYGFVHEGFSQSSDGSVYADTSNAAAFTRLDSATSMTETGFKYSNEYDAPEWIDGSTVLLSNGPGWPSDPIAIAPAGSGDSKGWFTDPKVPHPMDATISRNKRVIAAVGGPDRLSLAVWRDDDAQLLGTVYDCFTYSDPASAGLQYASPTFNADGTKLWWATGKGLNEAPIGDMSATCADGQSSAPILPGASSPDWGPAEVPTSRPVKTDPPKDVTPLPPVGGDKPGTGTGAVSLGVATTKAKLRTAVKKGLKLQVTVPAAGPVLATAKFKGKTAGRGIATAKGAGPVTVKVKFAKAARKRLLAAGKASLKVKVVAGTSAKTVSVKLGR